MHNFWEINFVFVEVRKVITFCPFACKRTDYVKATSYLNTRKISSVLWTLLWGISDYLNGKVNFQVLLFQCNCLLLIKVEKLIKTKLESWFLTASSLIGWIHAIYDAVTSQCEFNTYIVLKTLKLGRTTYSFLSKFD